MNLCVIANSLDYFGHCHLCYRMPRRATEEVGCGGNQDFEMGVRGVTKLDRIGNESARNIQGNCRKGRLSCTDRNDKRCGENNHGYGGAEEEKARNTEGARGGWTARLVREGTITPTGARPDGLESTGQKTSTIHKNE